MDKVYKGDIGTRIQLNAGTSISTATTLRIYYRKPSGTTGYWTATLTGTDYAYFDTILNSLDESGEWLLQLYVVMPDWTGRGESVKMQVYDYFR